MLSWRDQIIAHSDIDVRNPQLHKWSLAKGNAFPKVFKGFYAADMPSELEIKSI